MSAEAIAGTAAGVTAASVAMVFDQGLVMASVGGCFLYLGVSVSIPMQTRIFFSLGSFVLGYIVGMWFMSYGGVDLYAAAAAFVASSTGSTAVGSLHKWFDGGEIPPWLKFFAKLLPFSWKKGGSDD